MQQYADKEVFNQRFVEINQDIRVKLREQAYDNWLTDYETEIEKCTTPIIDLGCGLGNNTLYLLEKGKEVVACDYAEVAIKTIEKEMPKAQTKLFDMTQKFPFQDNYTDIVIADLCIHYFTEEVTKNIIQEIRRILRLNGILIFRVNSTQDSNFIAHHEKIDNNFIWQEKWKKSKRLFDEKSIRDFFKDWKIEKMKQEKMLRYEFEKLVWNCVVRKI